ncbi:MAG TPA: hypothetical protein VJH03_15600 [Blastocatellia bacterium]|nr:hypothetical protein [Blastocatellia bacterium]
MRIPVFVSCPTQLSPAQNRSREIILSFLEDLKLEPRALGRSDYPKDVPLKEVYVIAKHCHGGVILGFEQLRATAGKWKRGTKEQARVPKSKPVSLPSPWNQLEAGILFGLNLPLLIFRESEVYGGVFDVGTTEVFVHAMPPPRITAAKKDELKEVFLKWHGDVSSHYYLL